MEMPVVQYYSKPELQTLNNKICNEIAVAFIDDDALLTPEEITENINARLGEEHTVEDVKKELTAVWSKLIMWNEFMIMKEMVSAAATDYYMHISKSPKWKKKWK